MSTKPITWIFPATVLVTVGVLAYALYQHPTQPSSNGSGVQFPGFNGLSPTAPSSTNNASAPINYPTQNFSGAPLTMPTGTIDNLQVPAINVPGMSIINTINTASGAACGGCGNF